MPVLLVAVSALILKLKLPFPEIELRLTVLDVDPVPETAMVAVASPVEFKIISEESRLIEFALAYVIVKITGPAAVEDKDGFEIVILGIGTGVVSSGEETGADVGSLFD